MKNDSDGSCLYAVVSLLISPVSATWRGYALSVLWGWFIVPVFHAPRLSIPYAIGLSIIVTFLTATIDTSQKEQQSQAEKFAMALVVAFLGPLIALAFGWVVQLFV